LGNHHRQFHWQFFFKALSGNPQLQIGVFADTALVIY
jgi:hypothetical protein